MTVSAELMKCLSREDLVALITEAAANNNKFDELVSNLIAAKTAVVTAQQEKITKSNSTSAIIDKNTAKINKEKYFDISKYHQRYIAIQLQYEGGPYYGFAAQVGDCDDTIERHLFEALHKLRLIESRQTCAYTRCGRTDKGVSALGQVVSFKLRSALPLQATESTQEPETLLESKSAPAQCGNPSKEINSQVSTQAGNGGAVTITTNHTNTDSHVTEKTFSISKKKNSNSSGGSEMREMDYCNLLNKVMPANIRALGWSEVTPEFSARFSAGSRTYRYFFLRKNRDIESMRVACSYLIGEHDFRHLCKMDVANVSNFVRQIFNAEIVEFERNSTDDRLSVWMLEITGIAFLWHMIRCIMSVLLLVGEGFEESDIVAYLLDTQACPVKPHYDMAHELPLVLHHCNFSSLRFQYKPRALWSLTNHFQATMETHLIAYARAKNAHDYLLNQKVHPSDCVDLVAELHAKRNKKSKMHIYPNAITNPSTATTSKSAIPGYRSVEGSSEQQSMPQPHSESPLRKRQRGIAEANQINDTALGASDKPVSDEVLSVCNATGGDIEIHSVCQCNEYEQQNDLGLQTWARVLQSIEHQHGLTPFDSLTPHMPLRKRKGADEYKIRLEHLKGKKKERYDRHIQLQDQGRILDPNFFSKMKSQGSVST